MMNLVTPGHFLLHFLMFDYILYAKKMSLNSLISLLSAMFAKLLYVNYASTGTTKEILYHFIECGL